MTGAKPASAELPVLAVLPALRSALADSPNAILIAPPGAGKTTSVAPALLGEAWCGGQILLLSPRRVAARAAAEYMAQLRAESVGKTIGYATRLDRRSSDATRLLVVTEGIFRQRIIADPELVGVSAVLFDEVHERSLDCDFGLALALDAQSALRPDLRLVAMSATVDGARFAALMRGAPLITSEGRSYPLALRHIGRGGAVPIDEAVALAVRRVLGEEADGDILAFLPGVRDIDRTAERLAGLPVALHILHGRIDPVQQRAALRPDKDGRRKVILATSIAETSLTIDGVRIVIDSGLSRRAEYDPVIGASRLVTRRASQASATQRAGRAARQGPGIAYRLWEEAATGGMMPYDPPEILEADLSSLTLDCAAWGERNPQNLPWLDPPNAGRLADARAQLQHYGALDSDGAITAHGRAMAALPLPPPLAHMLLTAAAWGVSALAGDIAMLLSEPGLGGQQADIGDRLRHWARDTGGRAAAARSLAVAWAKRADALAKVSDAGEVSAFGRDDRIAALVATAYPARVSKTRAQGGRDWLSAGGRAFTLDSSSSLTSAQWLAVADIQGSAAGARIVAAAPMSEALTAWWTGQHATTSASAAYDPRSDRVEAARTSSLGAITLSRTPIPDGGDVHALLCAAVRQHGLGSIGWDDRSKNLRARAAFSGVERLSDPRLLDDLETWLPNARGLRGFGDGVLHQALLGLLSWDEQQQLARVAPAHYTTPAGTTHMIDYLGEAGPTIEARVQAFFGLDAHPTVGQPPTALLLSLTSPAGRPIQTTRDLPGFWRGSWRDVARELRGRYPKHPWPDDPWLATATVRTKRAEALRKG